LIRGAQGRHKACPYWSGLGDDEGDGSARVGRHKACPYWNGWGMAKSMGQRAWAGTF